MSIKRLPFKKGQPVILILLLVTVVILLVILSKLGHSSHSGANNQTKVQQTVGDTIDVAVEISPLSYYISGDSIMGLDYELINGLLAFAGRTARFHIISDLDSAIDNLDRGDFDVIISSLPSTQSLKETLTLSEPVYLDREVLVQLNDSSRYISEPSQLANDTVWIAAGSPYVKRIENLSSEIGEPIYVESPKGQTAELLVSRVARGEISRTVVNEGLARQLQSSQYPEIDFSTPVSFTQFQCWIVSEINPVFADSLNVWLNSYKTTPEYESILNKYGF